MGTGERFLSPSPQLPIPGLTGGGDNEEQLGQDTCPQPASQPGPHGPAAEMCLRGGSVDAVMGGWEGALSAGGYGERLLKV